MPSITTLPLCQSPTLSPTRIASTLPSDGELDNVYDTAETDGSTNAGASAGVQQDASVIRKSLHNWIRLKEAVRTYSSHSIPDLVPASSTDFPTPALVDDAESEEPEDDDEDTDEDIYNLVFGQNAPVPHSSYITAGAANLPAAAANQRHSRALELFRFRGLVRQKTEAQKLERVLEKWLTRKYRPVGDAGAVGPEEGGRVEGTRVGDVGGGQNAGTAKSRILPRLWRKKSERHLIPSKNDPTVMESSISFSAGTHIFTKAKRKKASTVQTTPGCESSPVSPHALLVEANAGNTVQTTAIESLVMVLRSWRTNVPLPYMHEVLGELGRMFYENGVAECECMKALQVFVYIREQGIETTSASDNLSQVLWCTRLLETRHINVRNRVCEILETSLLPPLLRGQSYSSSSTTSSNTETSMLSPTASITSRTAKVTPTESFIHSLVYIISHAIAICTPDDEDFPDLQKSFTKTTCDNLPTISAPGNSSCPTASNSSDDAAKKDRVLVRNRMALLLSLIREKANVEMCLQPTPAPPASDTSIGSTATTTAFGTSTDIGGKLKEMPRFVSRYVFAEGLARCLKSSNSRLCEFAIAKLQKGGGGFPVAERGPALRTSPLHDRLIGMVADIIRCVFQQRAILLDHQERQETQFFSNQNQNKYTSASLQNQAQQQCQEIISINTRICTALLQLFKSLIPSIKTRLFLLSKLTSTNANSQRQHLTAALRNMTQCAFLALMFTRTSANPRSLGGLSDRDQPESFSSEKNSRHLFAKLDSLDDSIGSISKSCEAIKELGKELLQELWAVEDTVAVVVETVKDLVLNESLERLVRPYEQIVFGIDDSIGKIMVKQALPILFKRACMHFKDTPADLHGLGNLLTRISHSHQQDFYKPFLACASSDNPNRIAKHLRLLTALAHLVGPVNLYLRDAELVAVLLLSDFRIPKDRREGKRSGLRENDEVEGYNGDYGTSEESTETDGEREGDGGVTLGQLTIAFEFLNAVRQIRVSTSTATTTYGPSAGNGIGANETLGTLLHHEYAKSFLADLERRIAIVLIAKERNSGQLIPAPLRILLCNLFLEIHKFTKSSQRPGWFSRIVEWIKSLQPNQADEFSQYRAKLATKSMNDEYTAEKQVVVAAEQLKNVYQLLECYRKEQSGFGPEASLPSGISSLSNATLDSASNQSANVTLSNPWNSTPSAMKFPQQECETCEKTLANLADGNTIATMTNGQASVAKSVIPGIAGTSTRLPKDGQQFHEPRQQQESTTTGESSSFDGSSHESNSTDPEITKRMHLLTEAMCSPSETVLTLAVAVFYFFTPEDLARIAPNLWEWCLTAANFSVLLPAGFMFMYSGEKVGTEVKMLLIRDLQSRDLSVCEVALRKILRLFGLRYQVAFLAEGVDGTDRRPFRNSGVLWPFVCCELGTPVYSVDEPVWLARLRASGHRRDIYRRIQELVPEEHEPAHQRKSRIQISMLSTLFVDELIEANQSSAAHSQKRSSIKIRPVLVPAIGLVSLVVIRLLYETNGALYVLTQELVDYIVRDDPALFLRVYFNKLVKAKPYRRRELLTQLRLIVQSRSHFPPEFSYILFNFLAGYLRYFRDSKDNSIYGPTFMAEILPLLAELVPSSNGLLIRDLRKVKMDPFFITSGSFWFIEGWPLNVFPREYTLSAMGLTQNGNPSATSLCQDNNSAMNLPPRILEMLLLRISQIRFMMLFLQRYPSQFYEIKKALRRYVEMPYLFNVGDTDEVGVLPETRLRLPRFRETFEHSEQLHVAKEKHNIILLSALRDRAWIELLLQLVRHHGRAYNNRTELGLLVSGVNEIIARHHWDLGIITQALTFYITIAIRFRRLFNANRGYSLFVPYLFIVYCEAEHVPAIQSGIDYAWGRFFAAHEESFVFQCLGSLVPNILEGYSKSPTIGKRMTNALFRLLRAIATPSEKDDLGIYRSAQTAMPKPTVNNGPGLAGGISMRGNATGGIDNSSTSRSGNFGWLGLRLRKSFALQDSVKLLLTIIAYDPGSLRAYQFIQILGHLLPLFTATDAKGVKKLADDGILALIDVIAKFAKSSKTAAWGQVNSMTKDTQNPTTIRENDQNVEANPIRNVTADVLFSSQTKNDEIGEPPRTDDNLTSVKSRLLALLPAFVRGGGRFADVHLKQLTVIINRVARDLTSSYEPRGVMPGTAWYRDHVIYTILAIKTPDAATRAVASTVKQFGGLLRGHYKNMDFADALDGMTAIARDPRKFGTNPKIDLLIYEKIIAFGLTVALKSEFDEDGNAAQRRLRFCSALVELIIETIPWSEYDIFQEIEKHPVSPQMLAYIILPLCQQIKSLDTEKVDLKRAAFDEFYWSCMLSYVLKACTQFENKSNARRESVFAGHGNIGLGTAQEGYLPIPTGLMPSANFQTRRQKSYREEDYASVGFLLAFTALKVILIRAENYITKRSLWSELALFLRHPAKGFGDMSISIGNSSLGHALNYLLFSLSNSNENSLQHLHSQLKHSLHPVDFVTWSFFEMLARYPSPLVMHMRSFIQGKLSAVGCHPGLDASRRSSLLNTNLSLENVHDWEEGNRRGSKESETATMPLPPQLGNSTQQKLKPQVVLSMLHRRLAEGFQATQDTFGPEATFVGDVTRWTRAEALARFEEDRQLFMAFYSVVFTGSI